MVIIFAVIASIMIVIIASALIIVPFIVLFIITVTIAIPTMIVLNSAAITVPVAHEIVFAVVMRRDPVSTLIRWTRPVPLVPPVTGSHGIPIPFNPHEIATGSVRLHDNHTRPWWRPHADSDRDLRRRSRNYYSEQKYNEYQG